MDPTLVRWAAATDPGIRYSNLNQVSNCESHHDNQDAYFVTEIPLLKGKAFAFGVFDGHGLAGEYASEKARDTIRDYLGTTLPQITGDWAKAAGN